MRALLPVQAEDCRNMNELRDQIAVPCNFSGLPFHTVESSPTSDNMTLHFEYIQFLFNHNYGSKICRPTVDFQNNALPRRSDFWDVTPCSSCQNRRFRGM
jgi:hypothetical protein